VDDLPAPVEGFDRLYDLEISEVNDDRVTGRVVVRDDLKQALGHVHGGVYMAIAHGLTSIATGLAVAPEGKLAMGLSNHTSFLRPITDGAIEAVAIRKHRGRTTWVWEVKMSDELGRLCALSRMTVAVREP
jgi:uncharacterized protein (TIGR00369 family)